MKKIRVVQFGTGFVGHFALRAIIEHPDLELVGVWVYNPAKVGMDAGDIAGTAKTGIVATNDLDKLLALQPDSVCSAAGGDGREEWMAEVHGRILRAGINIVSSSLPGMVDPDAYKNRGTLQQKLVQLIDKAARDGGVSYYTSGIEPGFMSDTLPLALSGLSQHWTSIRALEILDYSTYIPNEVEKLMGDMLGFGRSLDYEPIIFQPGRLTAMWGGAVTLMARGLGLELDEVREQVWRHPAASSYEIPRLGRIEKGTADAFRFELQGIVDGEALVVLEHVTRLRPDTAPQWAQGESGQGYYVYISGDPNLKCHVACTGPDGDFHSGGILATGTRIVNAIAAVCDARAGVLSALDLPLINGRGLLRKS